MPLQVELVAADRSVWKGEADSVTARTTEGEIGILPQHEPLIAVLASGTVSVTAGGSKSYYDVDGGFLTVQQDTVSIVAEGVESASAPRTLENH